MRRLLMLLAMMMLAAGTILPATAVDRATAAPQATELYSVTFDFDWSNITHPHPNFPDATAHFSRIIGATHGPNVTFWEPGALASPGIKDVAERGVTATFGGEINAAIAAGDAHQRWLGTPGGVAPTGTDMVSSIELTDDHTLVTVVTMVAPSPDWFTGVYSVPLKVGGAWQPSVTLDIYPYDAGTDSGADYTSPDLPTSPPDPIAAYQGVFPFSSAPLGTVTFTHIIPTHVTYLPAVVAPGEPMGSLWAAGLGGVTLWALAGKRPSPVRQR